MTRSNSRRNTSKISDSARTLSRIKTWKDGDIGHGSLRSYAPKQREFLEFCRNNCQGVIRTEAAQKEIVEALNISSERAHVAFLDLDALRLSGFEAVELFFGSKIKPDGSTYDKSYYGLYRSAFKKFYKWQGQKCPPEFDEICSDILTGIGRKQKEEEKKGLRESYERVGICHERFEKLCQFFLRTGEIAMFAMTILEWTLMCRVNQINELSRTRMKWREDNLSIFFNVTKMTQKNDTSTDEFAKQVYANPFDMHLCPITALGMVLLCTSTDPASNLLFTGNSDDKNFCKALKRAAKEMNWEDWDRIGSHSLRKGSWSYSQSGTTACPSFAATCMRSDHSLGNVKDRYFVHAAVGLAQDAYLGRILSSLNPMNQDFAALPPHFVKDDKFVLETLKLVCHGFENFPPSFVGIAAKALASVIHHLDAIKENLPSDHNLFQNILFRRADLIPRLKDALNDDIYESPSIKSATGIPPHIAVLRDVSKIGVDVKRAIEEAFKEHAIGQSTVSKVWITEQFSAVQQSLSEKINVVNNLLSAGGVAVQGNINGRFGRSNLPHDYSFPNFTFKSGWSFWLLGDAVKNVPPYQFLKSWEWKTKKEKKKFRTYQALMKKCEKILHTELNESIHFRTKFKAGITPSDMLIKKSKEYFKIIADRVAPLEKYKSRPVGDLGVTTIIRRLKCSNRAV